MQIVRRYPRSADDGDRKLSENRLDIVCGSSEHRPPDVGESFTDCPEHTSERELAMGCGSAAGRLQIV